MKKLILAIVLLGTTFINAQDRYSKGMKKAFELWQNQKVIEASNMFERIATAEPDKWLPYYYVAQINTVISFGEKDEDKLSKQLEKAKEFLDVDKAISPNNPELLIQEALINTAWIAFDGATFPAMIGIDTSDGDLTASGGRLFHSVPLHRGRGRQSQWRSLDRVGRGRSGDSCYSGYRYGGGQGSSVSQW